MKNCQNKEHPRPCPRNKRCDGCGIYTCSPNFAYHICIASNKEKNLKKKWSMDLKDFKKELDRIEKLKEFSPADFEGIMYDLIQLHKSKNHDYAGGEYLSDLMASKRAGILPWKNVLLRIQQKMSRLESFAKQGEFKVADEKVEDTCKDLAVYSILMLMLYKYKK